MMFRLTTIIALAGFVSAGSYSIGCMNTLMNIGNDPELSTCLAPGLLIPVLVGAGNSADSVINPLDAWLNTMCAQPACSNDALNALVANVSTGCSTEFSLSQTQTTLNMVQQGYATLRNAVCLRDGSTNCVTQTLTNLQSAYGTMSLTSQNIAAIVAGYTKGLPSSVLCTNCMKGAYTLISQSLPNFFGNTYTSYATQTCGASYTDGGIPPGLVQAANNPDSGNSDGTPATNVTPSTTSSVVTSSRPTASANANRKNNAATGLTSSSANLAVSGLVIVFFGMTLL